MLIRALAALAVAGCSLDWNVDAASGPDAAAADAAGDAATAGDAGPEAEASSPEAAPADAAPTEAANCSSLEANADAARVAAKKCTSMPSDCMSYVTDQCGCRVFVAQAASEATSQYVAAIQALAMSGCALGCGTCPVPTSSLCLVNQGLGTACSP